MLDFYTRIPKAVKSREHEETDRDIRLDRGHQPPRSFDFLYSSDGDPQDGRP